MPIGETNPFRILGTLAPSSQRLANAMTRYVAQSDGRILEVGAGSGAITRSLIRNMKPHQLADVVEIFPRFTALLIMRFREYSAVSIHGGDILDFAAANDSYDSIICSLPFNAFAEETTRAILNRLLDLASDGAIMSFFEYRILQGIAKRVLPQKKREEFLASHCLIEALCHAYKFDEAVVNVNFPPAVVHYLRIDKSRDRPDVFRRA